MPYSLTTILSTTKSVQGFLLLVPHSGEASELHQRSYGGLPTTNAITEYNTPTPTTSQEQRIDNMEAWILYFKTQKLVLNRPMVP